MAKQYTIQEGKIGARARSKRLRELGGGGGVVVSAGSSSGGDPMAGSDHAHSNLPLLDLLTYVDNYLRVDGSKIQAAAADDLVAGGSGSQKYARKDIAEQFARLVKFVEGVEVGN